jgi:hypothetical protein
MLVKPPATAAAAPVAIVSLCSCPGSRKCVHVYEAGRDDESRCIEDFCIFRHTVAAIHKPHDAPVLDQQIFPALIPCVGSIT